MNVYNPHWVYLPFECLLVFNWHSFLGSPVHVNVIKPPEMCHLLIYSSSLYFTKFTFTTWDVELLATFTGPSTAQPSTVRTAYSSPDLPLLHSHVLGLQEDLHPCHYTWLLHGKNCTSQWNFALRFSLTLSIFMHIAGSIAQNCEAHPGYLRVQ